MLFLIFSVLASVSVSLLLKFARARSLSIEQMVACNYWVAIALTLLFLQPDIALTAQSAQFSSAALWLLLGILLPSVFVAMGRAIATAGIIKSDAAQRLSLFLPVLAGMLLGVLNFLNILFYIKAHQAFKESPTLVFAGMNMGVIVLGTLAGAFVFRERVNPYNWAGIVLALAAIACLYYGQSFF